MLEPELSRREELRQKLIKTGAQRAGIAAIPVFIVMLILSAPFLLAILAAAAGGAAGAAVPAIQLYGFKSNIKDMVLSAAAELFGFTYNTLHPDVSGVDSWSGIKRLAMEEANKAKSQTRSLFKKDTGDDAPTPAFPVLLAAGLLPKYDNRKFEDLIEGERAETRFSLVECKLTQEQGSGNNRSTVTVFQGILLHIAYPQRFQGRTLLARARTWKWGKKWNDLQKVQLVSSELEKAFTVYSNDQVEARALLTPDRMERLIALERFFEGGKLRGIFEGDHLTVALEADDQYEVGSLFENLVNPAHYRKALHEMGLICDLIDGFLTREWVQDKL